MQPLTIWSTAVVRRLFFFRDPARGLTSYNERMCTYNICYTVLSQVACLANSERNNPAHELLGTTQINVLQQTRGEIFPSHFI